MTDCQPFFSIIVPTRQRPERLGACLSSLARLDYPHDRFEVIVVDDGSEQTPENIVDVVRKRLNATLITQSHAGPATARNKGATKAQGKFLAFTDDDCEPAPDWLQKLAARFAAMPGCAIGGRTINALSDNLYSIASQMLIDYLYTYHNASANEASFFTSNNLAMPADCFCALSGFDTSFPLAAAEDRELCDRWRSHGYSMIYAPEVVIYHNHSLTLGTFWRQHFNYGRGASYFHERRAKRGHGRPKLEPTSFYVNLLRYPLSQSRDLRALTVAALFILSQGANAAGFFFEKVMGSTQPTNHRRRNSVTLNVHSNRNP